MALKIYALSEDVSELFVLLSINLLGNTNVKATSKRLLCHFLAVYCVVSLVLRHFSVRKP